MSDSKGMGSETVCQVGVIVRDIEKSKKLYSAVLGLPEPEVMITGGEEIAHTRYKGEPSQATAKLAFFHTGQVSIELIEPIGGPSTWRDFLDEKGEGMHHIAFTVPDTDAAVAHLGANGVPVVQKGDYEGGRYTYADGSDSLGLVIELLENF